jgi:hypothetical protein
MTQNKPRSASCSFQTTMNSETGSTRISGVPATISPARTIEWLWLVEIMWISCCFPVIVHPRYFFAAPRIALQTDSESRGNS